MNQEQSIKRLEEISSVLADPKTDVKTAMSLFEEGVGIVKQNHDEIKEAKGRVLELKRELDRFSEIKFTEE